MANAVSDANYRKTLLGVDPTGNPMPLATDSSGRLKVSVAASSENYLGTWDASTNTPTITSGVGTSGDYYIVSVAGSTNIDGTSVWNVNDKIIFNGLIWEKVDQSAATIIQDWAAATPYETDEVVIESSILYRRIAAGISGATFDVTEQANWEMIGSPSGIPDWSTGVDYKVDETVFFEDRIYRANADHTSTSFNAQRGFWGVLTTIPAGSDWTPLTYYYADDIVVENDILYRRNTSGTSAVSFALDEVSWTKLTSPSVTSWRLPVTLTGTETDAGANIVGQTVYALDGVNISDGDFILLQGETTDPATYFGRVFEVSGVGASIALTLREDGQLEDGTPVAGDYIHVNQGNTNENSLWYFDGTDWAKTSPLPPYEFQFNTTTDWTPNGGDWDMFIPAGMHGLGTSVRFTAIYESIAGDWVEVEVQETTINQGNGDVTFTVSGTPDLRFAGKLVLDTGLGGTSSGGGTMTIGLLNNRPKSPNGAVIDGTEIFMQTADETSPGILGTSYQTIGVHPTWRNDTSGSAKAQGFYNADTTDGNGLTQNWETDTTGVGAQQGFATTILGATVTDHNHATVTSHVNWSTYVNGTQKTVWSTNDTDLYTDYQLFFGSGISANNNITLTDGAGFLQGNYIGGSMTVPAGTPVTGTNAFGTNLAQAVIWEEDIDDGVVPSLGVSSVGYVGNFAGLASGKTISTINQAVAGAADGGSVAGAIIDNFNMYNAAGIPGGSPATINNLRGFFVPQLFQYSGAVNQWGACVEAEVDNYFNKSVTIGGTGITSNPDIALDIQDAKAIQLGILTTVERDAIATPTAGMQIFNSDTNTVEFYDGTTWGSGGGSNLFSADLTQTVDRTHDQNDFNQDFNNAGIWNFINGTTQIQIDPTSPQIVMSDASSTAAYGASGVSVSETGGSLSVNVSGGFTVSDSTEIASLKPSSVGGSDTEFAVYFGSETTDGTWRMIRNGTDLEVQLRVAGVWVQKGVFTP